MKLTPKPGSPAMRLTPFDPKSPAMAGKAMAPKKGDAISRAMKKSATPKKPSGRRYGRGY